jgi:hypothetical protein
MAHRRGTVRPRVMDHHRATTAETRTSSSCRKDPPIDKIDQVPDLGPAMARCISHPCRCDQAWDPVPGLRAAQPTVQDRDLHPIYTSTLIAEGKTWDESRRTPTRPRCTSIARGNGWTTTATAMAASTSWTTSTLPRTAAIRRASPPAHPPLAATAPAKNPSRTPDPPARIATRHPTEAPPTIDETTGTQLPTTGTLVRTTTHTATGWTVPTAAAAPSPIAVAMRTLAAGPAATTVTITPRRGA